MDAFDRLLFNLNTIGSIAKGRRIDTSQPILNFEPESALQFAWRAIKRDSRYRLIDIIGNIIKDAILVSDLLLDSKYLILEPVEGDSNPIDICDIVIVNKKPTVIPRDECINKIKRLMEELTHSGHGVSNLIETYAGDRVVLVGLEPILKLIYDQVKKIKKIMISIGEI